MLLGAMAAAGRPQLGLIDAGGEAVVEERGSLRHGESCLFTSITTSWEFFPSPHTTICIVTPTSRLEADGSIGGHVMSKMSIKASNVFP